MTDGDYHGEHGLPDWLDRVPMNAEASRQIQLDEETAISAEMMKSALELEIGAAVMSMSIVPELRDLLAQFTENPAWKHLPTESTSVHRHGEDDWEVAVGERKVRLSGSMLRGYLDGTYPPKD
jgi:hypothetical protein